MQTIDLLNWKLHQSFVGDADVAKVSDQDKISAVSFSKSGDYIAMGDNAGRLIIFENVSSFNNFQGVNYQYSNELQSHVKENDTLILK